MQNLNIGKVPDGGINFEPERHPSSNQARTLRMLNNDEVVVDSENELLSPIKNMKKNRFRLTGRRNTKMKNLETEPIVDLFDR